MQSIKQVVVSAGTRSTGPLVSADTTCIEAIKNANNIRQANTGRINYIAFEIEDEDNIQDKLKALSKTPTRCYLLSLLKPDTARAKPIKPEKKDGAGVTNINLIGQYVQTLEKEFGDMTKKLNLADESVYQGIRSALDKAKIVIQNTNQAAANYAEGGAGFVDKMVNNFKAATEELEDSPITDSKEKAKNLVSKLVTSLQTTTTEHKAELSELIKMALKIMEVMLDTSSYNDVVEAIKKLPEIQGMLFEGRLETVELGLKMTLIEDKLTSLLSKMDALIDRIPPEPAIAPPPEPAKAPQTKEQAKEKIVPEDESLDSMED